MTTENSVVSRALAASGTLPAGKVTLTPSADCQRCPRGFGQRVGGNGKQDPEEKIPGQLLKPPCDRIPLADKVRVCCQLKVAADATNPIPDGNRPEKEQKKNKK